MTSCCAIFNARSEFFGEEGTRDAGRSIEPFDLGLVGGFGVEFGRGLIEARYTQGLLRINTDDNEPNDRLNNRLQRDGRLPPPLILRR